MLLDAPALSLTAVLNTGRPTLHRLFYSSPGTLLEYGEASPNWLDRPSAPLRQASRHAKKNAVKNSMPVGATSREQIGR